MKQTLQTVSDAWYLHEKALLKEQVPWDQIDLMRSIFYSGSHTMLVMTMTTTNHNYPDTNRRCIPSWLVAWRQECERALERSLHAFTRITN
jgi:hypothetical protein